MKNKVIVNSVILLQALEFANKVYQKGSIVPILDNFLLEVIDGKVSVSISNLRDRIRVTLPGDAVTAKVDFRACIPVVAKDYLKKLDDQPIVLTWEAETFSAVFDDDDGRAKYSGENPDDFPAAKVADVWSLDLGANDIAQAGDLLRFASADELRPAMTGVTFTQREKGDNLVTLFATDGHILKVVDVDSGADINTFSEANGNFFILPFNAARVLICKRAGRESASFYVSEDRANIRIAWNEDTKHYRQFEVEVITANIDERSVDFRAVLPQAGKATSKFTTDRKLLLKAIDKAALFANLTTRQIRFALAKESKIEAVDLDFNNEYSARIGGSVDGADITIGFNAKFLTKALESFVDDNVTIELTKPDRAGVIRQGAATLLIMPVTLNEYV